MKDMIVTNLMVYLMVSHLDGKTEMDWDLHMEMQMELNLGLTKELTCFILVASQRI